MVEPPPWSIGPVPVAAGRMSIDFIGRSPHDVDLAAVRLPARYARSKMLVGVGDPAVVFFFKGVLRRIRVGIAPLPEGLDELLALLVGCRCRKACRSSGVMM